MGIDIKALIAGLLGGKLAAGDGKPIIIQQAPTPVESEMEFRDIEKKTANPEEPKA